MLFAVIFTDQPDQRALRAAHLEAHVQWLAQHQDIVLVAGSLRTEPGAVPKGGLWIVEAPSKASVLEVMRTDPFYTCGLRHDVEVLHWSKAPMVVGAPQYRRKGLGSALVRHVIGEDPRITWVLRAGRQGAREFFGKLGFAHSAQAMERPRAGSIAT